MLEQVRDFLDTHSTVSSLTDRQRFDCIVNNLTHALLLLKRSNNSLLLLKRSNNSLLQLRINSNF